MRTIIKSVVMAAALIVGLYAMWEIGIFVAGFLKTPEQAAPAVEAAKVAPEKPVAAKPKARAARYKVPNPAIDPAPAPAAPARRVSAFPTEHDILPGTGRDELKAEYGEPSLRASIYDRGSLLETFVYQNESRSATTYAQLRNGSVIAAATAGMQ